MLAALAAVFFAGGVAPAFAQSGAERTAQARESARLRVGPFYFTPSLSIDNIGYDNNVFLDPESREPQSDFVISMTPRVRAALPIASRALVTFDLAPRGEYYRTLANARAFAPHGSTRAEVFFPRFDLIGAAGIDAGRRRPNFEIERRVNYTNTRLEAGVRYRFRSRMSFELGVLRTSASFEDELFEGVNLDDSLTSHDVGVRFGITRRITPKTSVTLAADRSRSHFPASPEKEGTRLSIVPGLTFTPNALIAGTLNVGVLKFTPEHEALPAFTGLVADADLSYTFREATRLTVRWRRNLNYSFQPLQPYYVLSALGASLRRQVVGRIDVIASFDQSESSYRMLLDAPAVAALDGRVDITRSYAGDLGFRLNRESRIGFRVATTTRTSNRLSDRDFRGMQMGLSYNYGM